MIQEKIQSNKKKFNKTKHIQLNKIMELKLIYHKSEEKLQIIIIPIIIKNKIKLRNRINEIKRN
jgi:hypothetical protein